MSGRQPVRAGASRAARGTTKPSVLRLARLDLRTDRSGSFSLAALVLVTTVLAGAVPILFARAADDALPAMMAAAEPVQRDLAFKLDGRLVGPIADPLAEVRAAGERLQADLPPSVAGLIDHGVVAADTPELSANELAGDGYTASLGFRAQPNIEERIRFTEGRAPALTKPVTEIAVSAETLSSLKTGQVGWVNGSPLAVGDQLRLFPERGDSMLARIVGVFEPIDPTNDEWADRALLEPRIIVEGDGDRVDVHGTALIATDQVPAVAERFGGAFRYAWRFILDWRGADAETRATIAADLAALRVAYPFRGSTEGSEVPSLSTGLLVILERYFRELAATQAAMTLALIGPACAAAGALGMIAATIARRRHEGVMLVRARGATDRQVLVARLLVAVIIVVPAVAAAALGLILAAGTEWAAGVLAIASTIAILAVALATASTAQLLRESGGQLRQSRPTVWWGGPRSLVRDGLIIALAVVGVVWIGQRSAARPTGGAEVVVGADAATVDPLLLLVPVLVALAGALIAWRAYVPLVRAGAAVAAAHHGFVPVHALRGPSRGAGALQVPLIVLVVTIAVGVFSTIVVLSLQREQDVVAWQFVGADYRVESATRQSLPLDMAEIPGVEAAADVVLRDGVLSGGSVRALTLMGVALDADGYRRVVAGTPADGLLPDALWTTGWTSQSGLSPESPIPAVLIGEAARRPALRVGDPFEMSAFGRASHFQVAGILPEFPGASSPKGTVIVPLAAIKAVEPERTLVADQSFVRASPDLGLEMRAATIGSYGAPNVELASRAEVRAAMEADPLVRDTSIGFVLALLVSVAFSALVVAVAVVRDVASRHGEIALLRALGTRPRQVLGVIVVEQGTVVLSAVTAGLVLGCLMGALAVPSLGLDRFVRPGRLVDAIIEWPVVSSVAVVQALVALLIMLVATAAARRRDPVPAMMRDA
ncbi:MAG: ABC transporter permease [Candidatus Limnocylindrales bacterium]